jgi:hypothetical protein
MATVAHAKHLHATVAIVNGDTATGVYGYTTGVFELTWPLASRANCSNVRAVLVTQHLHTMVQGITHDDVAAVIEGQTPWTSKLPLSPPHRSDHAHRLAVAVSKNMNAIVSPI